MATLTPEQATASLDHAARDVKRLNIEALRALGDKAVERLEELSPVKSGTFREGWDSPNTAAGSDIINTAPYASDVHGDFVETTVPEVLDALESEWQDELEKRITATLEGFPNG